MTYLMHLRFFFTLYIDVGISLFLGDNISNKLNGSEKLLSYHPYLIFKLYNFNSTDNLDDG